MAGAYIVGNYLVHPPAGGNTSIRVNGRTYSTPVGTPIPAPDFDLPVLEANGWIAVGLTGATAARPVTPPLKTTFMDTTVGAHIVWDGKTWRNSLTGASV